MTNKDVASVLQETADLIELTDGNPHRARAFARAARAVSDLDIPVAERLKSGTLTQINGIGEAMANHVTDVVETGTFEYHDELLNAIPPGLLDVLRVNGLGTKRTRRLWKELDVTSLDDLEAAAEADQITSLSGFGAKTQANILENVRLLRSYETQWRLADVWAVISSLLENLRAVEGVDRAEPTGPLRRHLETVDRADVLVATNEPSEVRDALQDRLDHPLEEHESFLSSTLPEGIPLRLHLTSPSRFGTEWWQTTGSSDHCAAFENTYGTPAPHPTEDELFDASGLSFIPPALRENQGEFEAASEEALPSLLSYEDLHGCLHNHSTFSDGSDSLRSMAVAARNLGYSYFGICDHSQSLQIANGLSPEDVREQHEAVQTLNESLSNDDHSPFRVFHSIESDILRDGSLDYGEEMLAFFDFVVASVHTGFSMSEAEATERVVRAVRNPYTRILGHPTGRLLLVREGYPLDHERVIDACAEHDVAIELNANPYRLDLDWRWVRRATEQGVLISINPDAHSTEELQNVRWGVKVGRKGWLTPSQCLNAMTLSDFEAWIEKAPSGA